MRFKKIKDIHFLIKGSKKLDSEKISKNNEEYGLEIPYELLLSKDLRKKGNK